MIEWSLNFEVSNLSPSGLIWRNDRFAGFNQMTVNARAGDICGYINNQGYWMVYVVGLKRSVPCHRIIYEITYGVLRENEQVDHKDGNRSNNNIVNLRKVCAALNSRNQKIRVDNNTGKQGVNWNLNSAGNTYAVAQWNLLNGKKTTKYFSVLQFGVTMAFKLAVLARNAGIAELNLQGAGYTERHGAIYLN